MRTIHILGILVLLALALPAAPAHAGGVVTVCDEGHLLAALAGGGTVTFACSGTITLTAEIVIATDTTLDGSGQTITISGNHAVRVFKVNSGVTLNLGELTVANGSRHRGGGIYNAGGAVEVTTSTFSGNIAGYGGGIYNSGRLVVSDSIFSDNGAGFDGGGIANDEGTVTVSDSMFSGNDAGFDGGGIANDTGTVTVSSSAFSGNSADYGGGGIYNGHQSTLIVSNSTFSGNGTYYGDGGGIYTSRMLIVTNSTFADNSASSGGGIYVNPNCTDSVTLTNTIVATSPTGGNCYGTITDGGGNLSYPDTTCPGINADPELGPLQNNLGPTETMALLPGSPAIDAGIDAICAADPVNNLDQRHVSRPQGPHCDIGAYEHQVFALWRWLPFAPVR